MTKTKANRCITKASTSKTSATKTSSPTSDDICLLVLGFDEQQKPCGARFVGEKPDLVAKAAQLMGLSVYKASSPDVAELPRSCRSASSTPTAAGSCRTCGKRSIATSLSRWRPNRSRPRSARTTTRPAPLSPAACRGSWDEIAPGHLVIAQESLVNGWWEAIVLDRKDDLLTLRFRDYPRLPKFFRHRTAVALMSPASDQA